MLKAILKENVMVLSKDVRLKEIRDVDGDLEGPNDGLDLDGDLGERDGLDVESDLEWSHSG